MDVIALDRAQQKKLATGYLLMPDNQIDPTTGRNPQLRLSLIGIRNLSAPTVECARLRRRRIAAKNE